MLQFITLVPILNTFPVTSISQRCPYSKPSSSDYSENDFGSLPQSPSNIVFVLFYYFIVKTVVFLQLNIVWTFLKKLSV